MLGDEILARLRCGRLPGKESGSGSLHGQPRCGGLLTPYIDDERDAIPGCRDRWRDDINLGRAYKLDVGRGAVDHYRDSIKSRRQLDTINKVGSGPRPGGIRKSGAENRDIGIRSKYGLETRGIGYPRYYWRAGRSIYSKTGPEGPD